MYLPIIFIHHNVLIKDNRIPRKQLIVAPETVKYVSL